MNSIDLKITPKLLQQQRLILTQDLQLFLKLIQMTTIELSQYLEEQLLENPTLEETKETADVAEETSEKEFDFKSIDAKIFKEDDQGLPSSRDLNGESDDDFSWENSVSPPDSLLDHLKWQLNLSDFLPEEREIASVIIGNINEDGYLEADLEEIASTLTNSKIAESSPSDDSLPSNENMISKSDASFIKSVEEVLRRIQLSFDPPGVCARDLKESLRIQLEDLGYKNNCLEMIIVDNHLESVSHKNYKEIANDQGVSIKDVEKAVSAISSLEPKPGRPFYSKDSEKYIVPDFFVHKLGNELQIQLNREFPKVRVSQYYKNLISKGMLSSETKKYIKEKIESAQRIVKCLAEREATIRKVIRKIVEHQKDFFEYGREYIKPLRLKDVAQDKDVSVHESTVSRITSRRYIHTPQGIIELKTLFSRKVETSRGSDISFERVKSMLKEIIANEQPDSPYSDEDIAKILERKYIKVARRTISKYRKILNIPPSSERLVYKG